jgi:DNA (cytosine-5)-methyltransferase 1
MSGIRAMDTTHFNLNKAVKCNDTIKSSFTFAEIFAGVGGFRLGLEQLGGRCVLASEIDKYAVSTYQANFTPRSSNSQPTAEEENDNDDMHNTINESSRNDGNCDELIGDISEYDCSVLPDFDILTGGFPCQPFSVRGSQEGLNSPKGQLFKELVRLLRSKKPK